MYITLRKYVKASFILAALTFGGCAQNNNVSQGTNKQSEDEFYRRHYSEPYVGKYKHFKGNSRFIEGNNLNPAVSPYIRH